MTSKNVPGGNALLTYGVSALMVDALAETRVAAMLRADMLAASPGAEPVLPQPELYCVPHSTLKRCVLELPTINGVDGEPVLAMGQSTKQKLARSLCFMHAEQLLDFYATMQSTGTYDPFAQPPLPLEEAIAPMSTAAPKERDFHSWDDYVNASERYAREAAARARYELLEQLQVPPCGHPIADRAVEFLRRNRKQFCRPEALADLNNTLRDGSHLIRVAHIAAKVFVATLVLDPETQLTATGVGNNSKDARRECAGHALCILHLLQQDAAGLPQGSPQASRGKASPQNVQSKSGDSSEEGEGDEATRPGAALDAVLQQLKPSHSKLLRFFNLLYGEQELSPVTTFTRERLANGSQFYHCELQLGDITCTGTGVNRFEAQRAAMDNGVSELLLYEGRLQALQAFIDAHPSIAPESVPSAALPQNLVNHLRKRLRPIVLRQEEEAARVAAVSADTGVDQQSRKEEENADDRNLNQEEQALLQLRQRAFAADSHYSGRMREALAALRRHPTYLTNFHARRSTLAMATVQQRVLDAIDHHRITVVSGTTGCGKTTQVPQYILDHEIEQGRGGSCNILVTQPRRLSSFSVAERIASERLSSVGKDVGYAVRLDARPGRHITICTTGVLLQILSNDPQLEHVSHLIIDEVHERDINCDVVLALVKGVLARNPRLRVVLMSATMQSEVFARYFGNGTPVIEVEGAVYPVTVKYLEDIAADASSTSFYSPNFDVLGPRGSSYKSLQHHVKSPRALLARPPKTDYNLIAYLVHRAMQVDLGNRVEGKSILIFLPGWKEMMTARASIESYTGPYAITAPDKRFHIILLHSSVDSAKQRECFAPAPPGKLKVVLATNIAESGITIDDAAVVIDTGLIKTTTWAGRTATSGLASSVHSSSSLFVPLDAAATNATATTSATATVTPVFSTQLTLGYASRANATQRKGRAGRTQGGVCYRLYTQAVWDALPAFPEADIHRVPLTQVLLKLLSLGYAHPRETLQTFLEPPSPANVEMSMRLLSDIGAVDAWERLTPLGEYLAKLPCDPRIGKMIIMGAVLQCLDSVLTVAACADVSPFVTSREVTAAARRKRYLLARGSQSDHISDLNAYNAYCANGESETFARLNLLHTGNLHIISKYKAQYRDIFYHAGLLSEQDGRVGECAALAPGAGDGESDMGVDESEVGEPVDLLDDPAEEALAHPAARPSAAATEAATADAAAAKASPPPSPLYRGQLCVDRSPLSSHSFNVALVKACVCAAMFPNVAVLRPPPHKGTLQRRKRQAEKVDLRTKYFPCIKPARESACRRVGGPRESEVPNRTELLHELRGEAAVAASAAAAATAKNAKAPNALSLEPPTPPKAVPALFYVFQDVFGVREARQEFLTTLSAVSLWALLLFGASDAATQYNADLSLCVIDDWIAVHLDQATFELVTELRQALFVCLHGKYHHPQDKHNNAALQTVAELCQAVLKAPVLTMGKSVKKGGDNSGVLAPVTLPSRLVDTGVIIDPLALTQSRLSQGGGAGAQELSDLGGGSDDGSTDSGADDEEEEEEEGVDEGKFSV